MSKPTSPTFWFVKTANETGVVHYAVAAWTERSARIQVRKQIGGTAQIVSIRPVNYSHAWAIVTRVVGRDNRLGQHDE